jgi:hypothetical protein
MPICHRGRVGWCGECYSALRGRGSFKGHLRGDRRGRAETLAKSMALKKPGPVERPAGVVGIGALDPQFMEMPCLWEYLTAEKWDDGSARQTSTLLFFVEDGRVKVCLNDRAAGRTAWATGTGFLDAMQSLEAALDGERVEWRKSSPGGARKRQGG